MDECAFPVLLVDLARREGAIRASELAGLWPMVKQAVQYIVRNGPVTGQDRWEEDGGYSPFTLAVEIAALLAAAELAEEFAEPRQAADLRETADMWNGLIEHWIYAAATPLAKEVGVDGYYVRIAPPDTAEAASPIDGFVPIKNRPPGKRRPAGFAHGEPGCARPRALRAARAGRSAHSQYREGDRRPPEGRAARGPVLAPL
jgi:glucoamylase